MTIDAERREGAARIHPSAIVESSVAPQSGVVVGPFCHVGPQVKLGAGTRLHSHVVIAGNTTLGEGCEVFPFASIGHAPQDKKFRGEDSALVIGARCVIREHVTMNPGTEAGGGLTQVGDDGLFLAGSHIAHDCRIGNGVLLVNQATIGGHCTIENGAIVGGLAAVHQWVRIGAHAFVGGMSGVEADVIPFGMVVGNRAHLAGLNIVGLKRAGYPREAIHTLRRAYRMMFASEGTLMERLGDVEQLFGDDPHVGRIAAFMRAGSDRQFCVPRAGNGGT